MKILLINMLVVITFNTNAGNVRGADTGDNPVKPSGFTLVQKRNGIALYERWFAFDSTVNAREIKIIFEARTEIGSAINMLRDEGSSSKWNPGVSAFRVVREGSQRWVSYIRYNLP